MTRSPIELDELVRRLEALERKSRVRGGIAACALFASSFCLLVLVLTAVRPPDPEIDSDAFVLRDIDGVERARLALEDEGAPELTLSDASGRRRAHVGLAADGMPSLMLRDQNGRVRAGYALIPPDGRPQLALLGPTGPPCVALTATDTEPTADASGIVAGRITLRDVAGATVFEAP